MINLNRYTKHGKFKLHTGQFSDVLYDVKEMICDGKLNEICNHIPKWYKFYVGIESAGAIIASHLTANIGMVNLAIITKDNELIGKIEGDYCLIDDVVTTENSIRNAIKIIGKEPAIIFCVVDRRINKDLDIHSIFKL